jgi:type VI secretion system secreted protein VgrG
VEAAEASPGETKSKQWDQGQTSASDGDEEPTRESWISIELKDQKGRPMPNESYEIKLPDGTISSGTLDDRGRARVEGIPGGQCEVRFPRLHNSEWRKA